MKVNGMEDLISMTVTGEAGTAEYAVTDLNYTKTCGDVTKVSVRGVFIPSYSTKEMWPLFIYIGIFLGVLL